MPDDVSMNLRAALLDPGSDTLDLTMIRDMACSGRMAVAGPLVRAWITAASDSLARSDLRRDDRLRSACLSSCTA